MGLGILNGNKEEDEQGEWTFTGTMGKSVIDYAICNVETWEEIKSFKIGERTEADHQPLVVEMKAKIEEIRREEEEREIEIKDWSEEGIKIYKENLKRRKTEKEGAQEEWEELVEEIRKAINKKTIKRKAKGIGQKTWWDKECRNSKTKLNRSLRQMKKGTIERREYIEEKQRHNKLCERKRKEDREREQKRLAEISNETEIWRYIRKERGQREQLDNSIGELQWKRHFMELLEGKEITDTEDEQEEKDIREKLCREEEAVEERGGITEEELETAIKRLKKKKATGEDGLKNENSREDMEWKENTKRVENRLNISNP
ncbi:inner centromere protein A-like [Ooceraea biroi]|uniref:inner centromere protein A-like n=1 Tax=Ooceraea biroi TaxID=2015173 RepID=UPI000F08CAAF|nr:inner centromere protein A-like [Ooceraea biroi]